MSYGSNEDSINKQSSDLIEVIGVKKNVIINVFESPFKINLKLSDPNQEGVSLAGDEGGDGYIPGDSN